MVSNYNKVREFLTTFGDYPNVALCMKLIHEEFDEVMWAYAEEGRLELIKELIDLLYVTYGALAYLKVDADAAFAEVHRSNMSKLGEDGKPTYREDGKILKGPNYSPADLRFVF